MSLKEFFVFCTQIEHCTFSKRIHFTLIETDLVHLSCFADHEHRQKKLQTTIFTNVEKHLIFLKTSDLMFKVTRIFFK